MFYIKWFATLAGYHYISLSLKYIYFWKVVYCSRQENVIEFLPQVRIVKMLFARD